MENQRFIEIDGQQIPVTEDVYRAYKRPLWTEHKRREREKRCRDFNGSRCTDNCSQCEKQRKGGVLSLEKLTEDGFDIPDPMDVAQMIEDSEMLEKLHSVLGELDSRDRQIIDCFCEGMSERDIAALVGLSQKGVNKRKTRLFAHLRQRLKDFY